MKWVKITIFFLIGLAVLPMIIISINNANVGTETIAYEITNIDEDYNPYGEYDLYQAIKEIAIYDNEYFITNIISYRINNGKINRVDEVEDDDYSITLTIYEPYNYLRIFNNSPNPSIVSSVSDYIKVGDVIYITYKTEKSIPLSTMIILSLIPVVFVSGLLLYLNKEVSNKE